MNLEVASDRLHFLSKLGEYNQRLLGTGLCRLGGPDLLYRARGPFTQLLSQSLASLMSSWIHKIVGFSNTISVFVSVPIRNIAIFFSIMFTSSWIVLFLMLMCSRAKVF